MFEKSKQILKRLFGGSEPIQVTSASQPHVLAYRMSEAGITHNEKVLADIISVRVVEGKLEDDQIPSSMTLFFCPIEQVVVKKILEPGDREGIPSHLEAGLKTISAPNLRFKKKSGLYNLKNVILCANGKITVEGTPNTKWVKV